MPRWTVHELARTGRNPWALARVGLRLPAPYADVNLAFGDIVKVTPSSKVVGDLAIFLVSHGMTVEEFKSLGPNHSVYTSELGRRHVFRFSR